MWTRRRFIATAAACSARAALGAPASRPGAAARTEPPPSVFFTEVPPHPGSLLLARPTDRCVTLSLLVEQAATVQVHYGPRGQELTARTTPVSITPGEPASIVLDRLAPDTAYDYRIVRSGTTTPLFPALSSSRFHTARPAGEPFTFTIQADSHLDEGCRTELYERCLANQLADAPDFVIDLGDTSMTGKHPSRESALKQYLAQRYYLGRIGPNAPYFFVVGNHDGEENRRRGAADKDGLAVWANRQRKRYFPNPVPDRFYTGNATPHPNAGLLENYYSWTWGDALFVVLDPYWTSTATRGEAAGWNMTLGREQYDWLARTLRASKARWKLVFIHQLVGGLDDAGRGGSEASAFFEWGGKSLDGSNDFAARRPGWPSPIHALLVETGVAIVFHGHDHFYARQVRDNVVYQLAPQPAHRNPRQDHAREYGYTSGEFLPNSGHLRVHVAPRELTVSCIRSATPDMARFHIRNGDVAATYRLPSL